MKKKECREEAQLERERDYENYIVIRGNIIHNAVKKSQQYENLREDLRDLYLKMFGVNMDRIHKTNPNLKKK